mmetsp:Transcript_6813/g.9533  ORF Transcript_6813/g.9533 Transcript_6813/m.9533 type:complete len:504 (-) Transcript_6813:85-1596(-)
MRSIIIVLTTLVMGNGREWDARPLDPSLKLDSLRALQRVLTELEPGTNRARGIEERSVSKPKYNRLPPTPTHRVYKNRESGGEIISDYGSDYGIMTACYRIGAVAISSCALAYLSVWPRNLDRAAYNEAYKQVLEKLVLAAVGPILLLILVFDGRKATLKDATAPLAHAFFIGAPAAALIESIFDLIIRCVAFSGRMADIEAPPRYAVRKLFCVQFMHACLITPIVEEYCKLRAAVGWDWSKFTKQSPNFLVHSALTRFISSAIGFKFADTFRRVALYSKPWHHQQTFFAVARGLFPIHELCAALMAPRLVTCILSCSKTNLLSILFPAVLLHASANFRGMKPLSAWSADAPWLELQLQAWNAPDDATPAQLVLKSSYALLWWSLLCRVLAFAAKQYYAVARAPIHYQKDHHFQTDQRQRIQQTPLPATASPTFRQHDLTAVSQRSDTPFLSTTMTPISERTSSNHFKRNDEIALSSSAFSSLSDEGKKVPQQQSSSFHHHRR